MRKILISIFVITVLFLGILVYYFNFKKEKKMAENKNESAKEKIRTEAVAGQFYPGNKKDLEEMIDELLKNANPPETEGEILALVLPHAGYQFSGQVAAFGFKKLVGEQVDTVLLIGNSHYERFEGVSIFNAGFFQTPLGKIKIDSDLANAILKESDRFFVRESAHIQEHSLEVQLPFLQKTLKNFKIVPILFGNSGSEDYRLLAEAIVKNIKGRNVILIASSDLSHYPPYESAKIADQKVIEAILSYEIEKLEKTISELESKKIPNALTFACGVDAIKTIMLAAKELGAKEVKLLNYANSGDVSKDYSRVVGYSAIGFFGERRGSLLNKKEREKLLEIAKTSVEKFVRGEKLPDFEIEEPFLNQKLGAFVTIKKFGQLRGCIGTFSPTSFPLYQVVSQMAISAAVSDPRFPPVQKDELDYLKYEISVLSELQRIDDWRKIEVGKHGVQVKKGFNSGVFLPQVATENNWDLERFLKELCAHKANLSPECYKEKDVELYIFTAQVFGEE